MDLLRQWMNEWVDECECLNMNGKERFIYVYSYEKYDIVAKQQSSKLPIKIVNFLLLIDHQRWQWRCRCDDNKNSNSNNSSSSSINITTAKRIRAKVLIGSDLESMFQLWDEFVSLLLPVLLRQRLSKTQMDMCVNDVPVKSFLITF